MHDIDHRLLGPIKYAVQRSAVTTTVRNEKILSLAFVSCQKASGKVAIELTNAPASDPAGGLRPTEMPRLVCSAPGRSGDGSLVKRNLAARWEIGPLGDTLARGLSPSALRRCVSIDVLQRVTLPASSTRRSQRIAMEITPYDKALDSVFTACGEETAFAPVEQTAPAAPSMVRPGPSAESGAGARSAGAPWKPARTTAKGRTNVRAAASLDSPIVIKLGPGTRILGRQASASWWKVKPRSGAGFSGFVRQDRLAFE